MNTLQITMLFDVLIYVTEIPELIIRCSSLMTGADMAAKVIFTIFLKLSCLHII